MARSGHCLEATASRCSMHKAPSRCLIWLVLLSTAMSWWLLAGTAEAAGPATTITVSLSPSSIVADGKSTTTATATVDDNSMAPVGVAGQIVTFSASAGAVAGPTTDAGNGTYTATITSSTTTVGTASITATDSSVTPSLVSAPATLTQTTGPPASIAVALNPSSIIANGTSTSTATATVTDAAGHALPSQTVGFTSSDTGEKIAAAGNTATITSSTTVGTPTITATDGTVTGTATLTQTTGPPATVTAQMNPTVIIANGTSTTTATATVKDAQGHLLSTETGVVFSSSDTGDKVSAPTNAGNGTYTATITSSTTVGTPTITATDGTAAGTATLTQTTGPPATVTVQMNPTVIIANGTATSTATATVTDAQGHLLPNQPVGFTSTDPGQFFGQVNSGNGTYSVPIRSSTTVARATITATDGTVSGQATLVQAAGPSNTSLVAAPSALVTNESVTLFADVSSASGSPSGTITFNNRGAPLAHCIGELITPSHPAASCQTSFAASTSPEQLTAVFTPDSASTAPGSTGATTLTVKPDSTSVSLDVSTQVEVGQRTTYTATVTPPASRPGPIAPSGSAEFFDDGTPIPACLRQVLVKGAATCTVAYKARSTHSITARYGGDSNFIGSTASAQLISVVPVPVHVLGIVTSTMQWAFYYTPAYTKVLSLVVNGASAGATVLVKCHGRGCPFAKHTTAVAKTKRCGQKGKRRCPTARSVNLAPAFRQHRLHVGAKITVVISRPNWIGKYYAFTIRARRGPSIQITCLAPGRTRPGVGCST